MKIKKVTIKILRVLKKSYSSYGNPKYYIVGLVNGSNYYDFKTGDNISSAYCGMYEGQTIEAQIHKTRNANFIIDHYKYINKG